MSNFLFFDKYILKTKLTGQQVCDCIAENIDQLNHFRLEFITSKTKPHEGEVFENSFEIRKIGSYRTSLLVFAKATINQLPSETQIIIRIRPSISALVFHLLWFGTIAFIAMFTIWAAFIKDLRCLLFLCIPVVMLILGSRDISFKRESEDLKSFLSSLLEQCKSK